MSTLQLLQKLWRDISIPRWVMAASSQGNRIASEEDDYDEEDGEHYEDDEDDEDGED